MRDLKLYYDNGFDIALDKTGYPEQIKETNDQRAAVACTIERGSIPCATDVGVAWAQYWTGDGSQALMDINMQCQQMIAMCAAGNGTVGSSYTALLVPDENGQIGVRTVRNT